MNTKRILSLFVVALLLFMSLTSCKNNTSTDPSLQSGEVPEEMLTISTSTESNYLIVVPTGNMQAFEIAYILRDTIRNTCGVSLKIVNDTVSPQEKEIILGKANRDSSLSIIKELNVPSDYIIRTVGSSLCITTNDDAALKKAVEYLISNILLMDKNNSVVMKKSTDVFIKSEINYTVLINEGKSDYVIITDSSNENSLSNANKLQKEISKICNVVLPIYDVSRPEQDCEILIGDTDRKQTTIAIDDSHSFYSYTVANLNGKIVLCGNTVSAQNDAVNYYIENLNNYYFNNKLMNILNYKFIGSPSEDLAKEIISSMSNTYDNLNFDLNYDVYDVFVPSGDDWFFNHHPYVTYYNNEYYAFWSNGKVNEDDCSQRIMMAKSKDLQNWETSVLVDTIRGTDSDLVLSCAGVYVYNGTINVYYYAFEYEKSALRENPDGTDLRPPVDGYRIDVGTFVVSSNDGVNFSDPSWICDRVTWNQSPQKLISGRLLWAGLTTHGYSDDISGVRDWNLVPLPNSDLCIDKKLCEGTFYQTPDGVIYMLQRSDKDSCIYCSLSFDNGESYTEPMRTNIPNTFSKFSVGVLPNGNYYFVGNLTNTREQLIIMTSVDGIHFSKCYYLADEPYTVMKPGQAKKGNYAYPTVCFTDEYMIIIYTRGKETVQILKIALSDLS